MTGWILEMALRSLDTLLVKTTERWTPSARTAEAQPGQHLALRAPFSLGRRAQGSAPGQPLPRHPTSVKRVNRVEERKLLPESETLWGGPQALRAHHNQENRRLYPRAPGRNSHSLAHDVREHQRGEGRGGYRSKPLKLMNHRSIRHHHHHRLSLSPLLSLCQLSVSSLSLSTTHQALRASEGGRQRL